MNEERYTTEFGKALQSNETPIPGLSIWDLPVHGDNRGWFKENWQREKMISLGLPDFRPVQNNISFNDSVGTTRGIHAEPWDKFVSVACGRIFGAWVDLRDGPTFGITFTAELDPSKAVFVPRGVGNAFQTLQPNTAYAYLVNDHYQPDAPYTSVNLADESLSISWPIPLGEAALSAKDRAHPALTNVSPITVRKTLVVGANGQLGKAFRQMFAGENHVEFASRDELDLTSGDLTDARRWRDYDIIINAAAYTAVDRAETPEGRRIAWSTNVVGAANLAQVAAEHNLVLVHISSDYVFDGASELPYREDAAPCPLSVYGQTKAASDLIVATAPKHYIVRTSWVIGDGPNFVRTMLSLASRGINPSVVNDQFGRLTFTTELANAIRHLLTTKAPYGTYNVTGAGPVTSWADIARQVFTLAGHEGARVKDVTTDQYLLGRTDPTATRPKFSALDTTKVASIGYVAPDAIRSLRAYVQAAIRQPAPALND